MVFPRYGSSSTVHISRNTFLLSELTPFNCTNLHCKVNLRSEDLRERMFTKHLKDHPILLQDKFAMLSTRFCILQKFQWLYLVE